MSGVDTRNITRDSLFLLAELRLAGTRGEHKVKVRNLSGGGMMAEGPVPVVPGNRLQINLRNIGWVDGAVAWVQENRFGIAFDREINAKLARAPSGSNPAPELTNTEFLRSHAANLRHKAGGLADIRKI